MSEFVPDYVGDDRQKDAPLDHQRDRPTDDEQGEREDDPSARLDDVDWEEMGWLEYCERVAGIW